MCKKSVKGGVFVYLLKDKTDIKIFILYLLMNMERPVDLATLNDIVVQDDFVGQFDFMDCFYELCETDAIIKTSVDGTEYYAISEEGKMATEALQSDLLKTIREKVCALLKECFPTAQKAKKARALSPKWGMDAIVWNVLSVIAMVFICRPLSFCPRKEMRN